ncbi:hypothetical protein BD310DRAFT_691044 [Dichomitus squalens]|uniref:Uncharacterized protein n=1 Tax=Dichomitus squalens TaxID=114155 RepID=A0A4Q9PM42_9APHY|nr:hypothetical protein BD310DRAFT_691044 [Dichomitus squalens]
MCYAGNIMAQTCFCENQTSSVVCRGTGWLHIESAKDEHGFIEHYFDHTGRVRHRQEVRSPLLSDYVITALTVSREIIRHSGGRSGQEGTLKDPVGEEKPRLQFTRRRRKPLPHRLQLHPI